MPFDYQSIDLDAILQRAHDQMNELQRPGVGKARARGRVMFDVWMGVGKTLMGLTSGLCFRPQTWIIITPTKTALNTWIQQIAEWYPEFSDPDLFQLIRGTSDQRYTQYSNPRALFFGTTAGSFIRDIEWLKQHRVRFDVITIDEIDKLGLRNKASKGFKAIKELVKLVEHSGHTVKLINPMTGTWTSKGSQQEWPVLNLLAPKEFSSYWKFLSTYNWLVKTNFGTEVGAPKNMDGHAIALSAYVHKVSEADAKQKLPGLHRRKLYTTLPPKLRAAYYSMAEQLFFEREDGEVESVQTILASYMKLRQLITAPSMLLQGIGPGPAIEAVADKILEVQEIRQWRHNIVFTPFLASIPIFKQYLADALGMQEGKILIIQGGMEAEELQEVELRFRNDLDTMILASLKSSSSWNAETTFNVYFPHFEWDQDWNKQAEGRSRRTSGTQEFINSYYVDISGTITDDMFDVLNHKEHINSLTLPAIQRLKEKLRKQVEANRDHK